MNHCKIDEEGRALCVNLTSRGACDYRNPTTWWVMCAHTKTLIYENLSGVRRMKLCTCEEAITAAKIEEI